MPFTPNDPAVKNADSKPLQICVAEDERHRLHTEPAPDAASASPYFRRWVDGYVTRTIKAKEARERFLEQIVWPLVSNELVDTIMDAAAAVHYAQDRYIDVDFTDEKLKDDFLQYLEQRDLNGFFARNCHNALFGAPNSFIVVDLPAEQTTAFPEPYVYLLSSKKMKAAEAMSGHTDSGMLRFGFFETDKPKQRALFDEECFALYERSDARTNDWELKSLVPHNLPYCPVFKLWPDVDMSAPMVSNTPIRPQLGKLDRYVFWDGACESNDLSAGFKIFWYLETEPCSYKSEGFMCQHGVIEKHELDINGQIIPNSTFREPCPIRDVCPAHSQHGPGSKVGIPAQQTKDQADWRPAVGWVEIQVEALKLIADKVKGIASSILGSATGHESGPQNDQALNESQIMFILDKGRQVGQYLAEHFEKTHKRTLDAWGWLRYGSAYLGSTVSYGRRFVMLSGDQLMILYEAAKKIGSLWLIEEIDGMLQDYYARSDASRKLRYQLLTDLNPYPYQAAADLVAAQINLTDPIGYMTSVGLMRWVKLFEAEVKAPIERFGSLVDYQTRVSTISKAIQEYVKEHITNRPDPTSGQSGEGDPDPTGSGKPDPTSGGGDTD
jgi:hypothetical protein